MFLASLTILNLLLNNITLVKATRLILRSGALTRVGPITAIASSRAAYGTIQVDRPSEGAVGLIK